MASGDKRDRPIQFYRRDTSRLDAALRRPNTDGLVTDKNGIDVSRIPSPSTNSGVRPRRTFGKTSTLTGAFEATAPQQQQAPEERDHDQGQVARGTPSPSSRRIHGRSQSSATPIEDISSPPELQETYRQINESDHLINLVAHDDFDQVLNPTHQEDQRQRKSSNQRSSEQNSPRQRPSKHKSLNRRSPNQRSDRQLEEQHGNSREYSPELDHQGSGLNFSDDTDDSFQKRLEMHAMDEQRLQRVTSRGSPILGRANADQNRHPAAESFQRQNDERGLGEDGPEPALNIPKAWAERGQSSKERMSYISRRNLEPLVDKPHFEGIESEPRHEPGTEPIQDWENDLDFTARDLQVSDSPPVGHNFVPTRGEANALARKAVAAIRLGELNPQQDQVRPSVEEGDPIPNTPIVVYKSNQRHDKMVEKPDSREFLRELALRESPSINTPEQKPVAKDVLLAKTPVVTGAWIDTPMTERVTDLPVGLTRDIVSPSPNRKESELGKEEENERQQAPEQPIKPSSGPPSKPQRRQLEKPKVPKSALETVLESARSDDNALSLGEDTIDSLQGILNEELSIFSRNDNNAETESDETSSERTVTNATNLAIGPLDSKFQSLVRSIHDAQKVLSSLERQIASAAPAPASAERMKQKRIGLSKTSHDVDVGESCDHDHDRHYVALPVPRLWKRVRPSNRLRPSRLGYFLLILMTWYLVELSLCDIYCHPLYAHACRNCIRPDAPRFPYVLPTMLWRWFGLRTVLAPLWVIVVAVARITMQICGLSDGYVEDRVGRVAYRRNGPHIRDAVPNDVPVASWRQDIPTQETRWDDGSMGDDAYI